LDHRQYEHGQKTYGQFLRLCPDATTFFQPTDTLLDHRATPIALRIEVRILVTFVGLSWDHRLDPMSVKPLANATNAVGFVTGQPPGTLTPSAQWRRDADVIQNRFQLRRLMLLSAGYFDRQRHDCTVSDQVEFAAESTF